ncbi:MAG: DUF4238 domain-containing protein [Planctomycetota bacterium]
MKRKHHYVPVFYLSGFTVDGHRESPLWVLDTEEYLWRQSKPSAVALKKDLYRVDVPGFEPDEIENTFMKIETASAVVFREIRKTGSLPERPSKDFGTLMTFIAMQTGRTPWLLNRIAKPLEEMHSQVFEAMFGDRDELQGLKRGEDYWLELSQNHRVGIVLSVIHLLVPMLFDRSWCLLEARDGPFICSEHPVGLKSKVTLPPVFGPGFGMTDTVVTMPISKRFALQGEFQELPPTFRASLQHVAAINSDTARHAGRFLYASSKNFLWLNRKGRIESGDTLADAWKEFRSEK